MEILQAEPILAADATAVIAVIVVLIAFVLLILSGRRKVKEQNKEAAAPEPGEAPRPAKLPASKEVFDLEPAKKTPEPAVPAEPDDEEAIVPNAWELAEEGDEARARELEAKVKADEKVREAEAKKKEAEEKAREAQALAKAAEEAAKAAEFADAAAKARAEKAAEAAKVALDEQKKAEHEAKAEAARAAEARDKAVKEAAERAKAEHKAAAEAESRAKAEAKKKEAAEKAKADAEAKAKAEAEEAKRREAEKKKAEEEAPKTLEEGLRKTRKEGFIAKLSGLFAGKQIDQDLLDEVEEVLFTADIGVRTAERLLNAVREALSKKELKDANKVWDVLRGEAQKILEGANAGAKVGTPKPGEPFVTMVLGVNGTGKTTSIGKMAHKLLAEGKSVTLVAGDTFRAAATEQLEHWAHRVGAPVIKGKDGADPASVVFDGVKQALEAKAQYVLVDTAGRLHTNTNLMEELKKVRRVMGRAIESAPHEVLMVLDATTGQNGITQAKLFKEATDVTGIILTKLDGTAKGGVVLGVCDELKIPIKWVGIGERVADLRPFDPKEFVDELFSPPS